MLNIYMYKLYNFGIRNVLRMFYLAFKRNIHVYGHLLAIEF